MENVWLTKDVLIAWFKSNSILASLFAFVIHCDNSFSNNSSRNNLHQAQYVAKVEEVVRFLIMNKALLPTDLAIIWNSQSGQHASVVTNVFDLLARLAVLLEPAHLDQLFQCVSKSVGGPVRSIERTIDFLRRLAEDDVNGKMAGNVLELLWKLAHDVESPNEVVEVSPADITTAS